MTNPNPLGHPDNERTTRASVDSVLLAQAFWCGDMQAVETILRHCDPYSTCMQLCGWLFATFRESGVDVEERLEIWLAATRNEIGEPS